MVSHQTQGDIAMRLQVEGGCLCGRVRYRIDGEVRDAGYCHCRICQRAAGAPVVAWFSVGSADFAWSAGEAQAYRSTPGAERLFCPSCGTQLVFRELAEPGQTEVTIASLDDPAAVVPDPNPRVG